MKEEYDSLMLNKTWTLSKLPEKKKAIPSKWVFKTKVNGAGEIVRYKARLVAKGFNQQKGIDYKDIYATQPIGFDDGSSRVWNEELNKVLLSYGLKRSDVDQCIYYHKEIKFSFSNICRPIY